MLLLAGCGSYRPAPLDDGRTAAALAGPSKPTLVADARRLVHPRIAPIDLDLSKPLTGDELAVIAVLVNPDLKALRARQGVSRAQVFDAGLLPDPQLAASLFPSSSGQPSLSTAYNLGLTWDLLGLITRQTRRRVAEDKALQVRNDIAWNEWTTANQARLQAFRLTELQRQHALTEAAAETARALLETSRRNLARHDIRIDDNALREVAFLDARNRSALVAQEIVKTRLELNRLLGLPPTQALALAADPEIATPVRPVRNVPDWFDQARRQRLDLIALRAGYQGQEAQIRQDLLARFPQLNIGFQQARDTSNITTIGFSLGITLPILNGGRGTLAIDRATREQLHAEYDARLAQARSDIATLVADIDRIDREAAALASQLPALAHASEVMRRGLENGDVTPAAYEIVRAGLLDKQLVLLGLQQSRGEQQIALQTASGAAR